MVVKMRLSAGILGADKKDKTFFVSLLQNIVDIFAGLLISFTIITRVNSLSEQKAAELVFSVCSVLDFHQVGRHAERIVLQVTLALLTTTGNQIQIYRQRNKQKRPQQWSEMSLIVQFYPFSFDHKGALLPFVQIGKLRRFSVLFYSLQSII